MGNYQRKWHNTMREHFSSRLDELDSLVLFQTCQLVSKIAELELPFTIP